ncbi:MAG: hypothetical protein GOU97_00370 [Nanoarchaeota archaeon]|nr:hypothetical protein [Nanoarchaeota archaeon]
MVKLPGFLRKKESDLPLPLMPTRDEVMGGSELKSAPLTLPEKKEDFPAPEMPMPRMKEPLPMIDSSKKVRPDLFIRISEYKKAKDAVKELRVSIKEMLDSLMELEKIKERERAKLLEADNTLRSAEKVVAELDDIFQLPE